MNAAWKDQVGALGLGLNAIIWWNSLCIDAAVKKLDSGALGIKGGQVTPEIRAHVLPLMFEHINFHGFLPVQPPRGRRRTPRASQPGRHRKRQVACRRSREPLASGSRWT
ncbi:Tn3 family transposase [Nonomuraea roseola]|uniref:Tn3 family transposase n=1 Tax=Nonomuraea roseola TaxID=46179 RepID=A0ABV5QD70_9ACTN